MKDRIDPVTFEVLRNAFVAAVDEMGLMLEQVAFSLVVSEGRDFSTSFCDVHGNLVADGTMDLPTHVGTLPFAAKSVLELITPSRLHPGDVIIMNDPYLGGTHCQDFRALMPVYWEGQLVAIVHSSVHLSDAGGKVPGSWLVDARTGYEEARYVTPIHLVREGTYDEDVLRLILRNIRVPDVSNGDIVAMVEACRTGEARLHALLKKYGRNLIVAQMDELLEHSRGLLESHFRKLPEGTYSFTDYIDFDPCVSDHEPIPIHLDLTIKDGHASFDFSLSAPKAEGALNISRALLSSGVAVATKAVFPDVPVNEGLFRAIDVVAPEGLIVTGQYPAATSAGVATAYEKVIGCVLGCFLQIVPNRSMVGCGNISNFVLGGFDSRPGYDREFLMYEWSAGGYGARPGKRDNHSSISLLASGTRNQPIESMERAYPVLFDSYGYMPDSGGPGRHRGGLGISRSLTVTHGKGILSSVGDRELIPAWGYARGRPANIGDGLSYAPDRGPEETIGVKRSGFQVEDGSHLRYWEGGGGGYGAPWERPAQWVLEDVINGYVSIERARDDYFVAIDVVDEASHAYVLNDDVTKELRGQAQLE